MLYMCFLCTELWKGKRKNITCSRVIGGGLMGLVSKGPRKPCFCVFTYTVSHCEKPNVQTQPPSRNMPLETKSNEEGLDGAEETLESSEYDLGRILLQHFSLLKSENNREPSPTFISIVLMNIIRKKREIFQHQPHTTPTEPSRETMLHWR